MIDRIQQPCGTYRHILLLTILAVVSLGRSQDVTPVESSFSLSGLVRDTSGVPVANATAALMDNSKALILQQVDTDPGGHFSFSSLPTGIYSVRISSKGFGTKEVDDIHVDSSTSPPLQITVGIGQGLSRPEWSLPDTQGAIHPDSQPDSQEVIHPDSLPDTTCAFCRSVGPIGLPATAHLDDPVWNFWAVDDASSMRFTPIVPKTGSSYSLVVSLAALLYSHTEKAVYSVAADSAFTQLLKETTGDTIVVDLVLNPDPQYYTLQDSSEISHPMTINLNRMRDAMKQGFSMPTSPFAALRASGGVTDFNYGIATFRLHTKFKPGWAPISLEIWNHDTGTPLTEATALLCIIDKSTRTCGKAPPHILADGLKGVDLSGRATIPDVAIHISERTTGLVGVYRCNASDCPDRDYHPWELGQDASWLVRRLRQILTLLANSDKSDPSDASSRAKQWDLYADTGKSLFDVVFYSNAKDPRLVAVIRNFTAFEKQARLRLELHTVPRTLFVRVLSNNPEMILVPWDLMVSPGSARRAITGFVGGTVYVETPLESQNYHRPTQCISKWMLFIPPPRDSTLNSPLLAVWQARDPFDSWIERFKASCTSCIYDSPQGFKSWLRGETSDPPADIVVTLSHHSTDATTDALFFYSDPAGNPVEAIDAGSVKRPFPNPSLLILDGCGTGMPGSSEFIRTFNNQGVNTVLATSIDVGSKLAGAFLAKLLNNLAANASRPEYTIGNARWDAIHELSETFGPSALVFTLAGNSGLRACVPSNAASISSDTTAIARH